MHKERHEYLRLAKKSDCEQLFCWANEREVRKASFQTGLIAWETHVEWFRKMMENENIIQFIYERDEEPVGQVRLDIQGDCGVISYSIASEFRGQGMGKRMIAMLEKKVKKDYPALQALRAEVKWENNASKNVFEKMNFKESEIIYTKMLR